MSRPVFGVTDSPRAAARKKRAAKRAEALLDRSRAFVPVVERGPDGEPIRMFMAKNPHYRPPPRLVCPDGGGRCSARCELIECCPGPVPNPALRVGEGEGR